MCQFGLMLFGVLGLIILLLIALWLYYLLTRGPMDFGKNEKIDKM